MRQHIRTVIGALLIAGSVGLGVHAGHADEKLVNINSATATELASLKGLGDAKAKAIVAYREKNGPFKSVDDLDQVSGIGNKLLAALRPQVTTGAAAASAPAPARAAH